MIEEHPAGENPFCTRRIRPGAVPFCFPSGVDIDKLLDRLRRNQWRGEIVGPHGSGKSTLLASILKALEQAGPQAVCFELHDGQRSLPRDWRRKTMTAALSRPAIVVVDGYEQLSLWSRFCLKSHCRRRHLGLLVTSHAATGLPEIYRTSASLDMALQIVEQLMQKEHITIPANVVADSLARHGADIRELLFYLYDFFEQQRNKPEE
jgi:ABC-type branched-subunit amino acid transport system ATPase component